MNNVKEFLRCAVVTAVLLGLLGGLIYICVEYSWWWLLLLLFFCGGDEDGGTHV